MLRYISVTLLTAVYARDANHLVDDTALVRHKRAYYLCGVFPNQYYSDVPCQFTNQCANGGRMLGVGCTSAIQCTPYTRETVTCINGCCCTVPTNPTPAPPIDNTFGYCPSGQLSQARCSSVGQCSRGQTCMNGLCCTTVGTEYQYACGGLTAVASCSNGFCGNGMVCTASNYCCECPFGRSSGLCSNGCPSGFSCSSNGYCCATCPGGATPLGACRNGACLGSRVCSAGNLCC